MSDIIDGWLAAYKLGAEVENEAWAEVLLRLLLKFHNETECGVEFHWAECEAACDLLGVESFEEIIQ